MSKKSSAQKKIKDDKKKKTKKKKFIRFLKSLFVIFLVIILLFILTIGLYGIKTDSVTDSNFWKSKFTTNIYDRNDKYLTSFGEYNIDYVKLDEVSEDYLNGLVATEDEKFYSHRGVSLFGLMRATWQTLFTDTESGGSTITMQLAKNLYLAPTQAIDKNDELIYDEDGNPVWDYPYSGGVDYKLKQMVYAWKIEGKYSKDEILENYINFLNFDNNIIGIENAANYYFGISAKDLTLSESAMLAGMTQLPHEYNPYINLESATKRRDVVLDRMLTEKYITEDECKEAKKDDLSDHLVDQDEKTISEYDIYRPYLDVVQQELYAEFGDDFAISTSGIDIYTNLDTEIQKDTYAEVNNLNGNIGYIDDVIQAGTITLDSQTGDILAVGGGRTTEAEGYPSQNYGAYYKRQPGSTSKPIVDYGPAIEYLDWSTSHELTDQPVTYSGSDKNVKNAYDGYLGTMTIQEGLARSSNTIALQTFKAVEQQVGVDKIEKFMKLLGITDSDDINEAYSIGGWQYGTTPLELAGAYASFANEGVYNEPHAIRYVVFSENSSYYDEYGKDNSGKYEFEYTSNDAMSDQTAYMVTKMLDPLLSYSLSGSMYINGYGTQAIKTGTSNWDKNDYGIPEGKPRDKWVAGYNGDVTTVVWSGYDGEAEKQGYYFDDYGYWSYNLYRAIMQDIYNTSDEYLHNNEITKPDDVSSYQIGGTNYYAKKDSKEDISKEIAANNKEKTQKNSSNSSSKTKKSSSSSKSTSTKKKSSSSKSTSTKKNNSNSNNQTNEDNSTSEDTSTNQDNSTNKN